MTREERQEILAITAAEIARHLGGWTPKLHESGVFAELNGPDGRKITLHWPPYDRMATVRGKLPPNPDGSTASVTREVYDKLSINVNPQRPADALARDIERRLLPTYDEAFARQLEHCRTLEAHARTAHQLLERVAQAAGAPVPPDEQRTEHERQANLLRLPQVPHPDASGCPGTIKVFGPTRLFAARVKLDVELPVEVAEAVLRAIYGNDDGVPLDLPTGLAGSGGAAQLAIGVREGR